MKKLISNFRRRVFGYDIFISYSRNDGLNYSYAIAQYFLKKGYECYIDQIYSSSPGVKLPRNIQDAVARSTSFVLVGSTSAQKSEPISNEIQLFLDARKNRPLIPIAISGAINEDSIWYSKVKGLALIEDNKNNLDSGIPSTKVLDRIENALTFTKKSAQLRRTFLITLIAIVIIVATAMYFTHLKNKEANRANDARIQAESLRESAENERAIALTQMKDANVQKIKADSLRIVAEKEKSNADSLAHLATFQKLNAEKRAKELNFLNENQKYRLAASEYLSNDPVKAFRLAQRAYNMINSEKNRALLMSSISQIDFYYTSNFDGYEIMDFKEPYILLVNKNTVEGKPNLLVYDMGSNETKETSIYANLAWLVPYEKSWRILARSWNGIGFEAIQEYQLWSSQSEILSERVKAQGWKLAQFINKNKVIFDLHNKKQKLLWDLHTNEMKYVDIPNRDDFSGTYFYEIYGALDTRSDGLAAGHYNNGLILINSNGEIDESSYTQVDFDPSSFFTRANWSPDDRFLALNYFDRKRLGVWNPSNKDFVWLDPDGWVVNSYSWSQSGHLLAFSGRTENEVDVTVEILNGNNPIQSREIVFKSEIPVQSLAFSSDDKHLIICDKESNMYILDIITKEIIGTGQQVDKVYSSNERIYTSGKNNFKVWGTNPSPIRNWLFISNSDITYYPKFTSDLSNSWIAAPFFQKSDTTSNYEVRNVISGSKKIFSFNESIYNITAEFSNGGNWLLMKSSEESSLWNTQSWKSFKIPTLLKNKVIIEYYEETGNLIVISESDASGFYNKLLFKIETNQLTLVSRSNIIQKPKPNTVDNSNQLKVKDSIEGWELDKLYKYRAAGWNESNQWAVLTTCRDGSLGARDCDIQFIPTNIEWVMNVINNLVWKPTDDELISIITSK